MLDIFSNHGQVHIPNTDDERLKNSTVPIPNNVHHETLKNIASSGEIDQRKRSRASKNHMKENMIKKTARRTRPRISTRHVKINPDESEDNSISDKKFQPVKDSDSDDEQQHSKRIKRPEMNKDYADIPDQRKRNEPSNSHRKEIAITKPARRARPRISRCVKINPDELENKSVLDRQSQPVIHFEFDDEKRHNKRIKEPEMIKDHSNIQIGEAEECLDAESQGKLVFEEDINLESNVIDELGRCASQRSKIGLELDPVQAMLFDMVPSLSQKKAEIEVPKQHELKPKPETELNADLPTKKKVSYRDIASQLLNDL